MTPTNRRRLLLTGAAVIAMGMGGTSSCTSNIDPTAVINLIKVACGILVPAATIADILLKDPTMTASAIVNLICTGFMSAKASGKLGAEPAKGTTVNFVVYVNGKPVDVSAVVQ